MAGAQDPLANAASNEEAAMRPAMVSNPMPGEQDVPPDIDADPEAAMREMMGFSSFTTRPKKRLDANSLEAPSLVPASVIAGHKQQNPFNVRDPNGTNVDKELRLPGDQKQHLPNKPQSNAAAAPSLAQNQPAYAFTSPQTGISYTRQELEEWTRGKVNERGDKVYFKPGFVAEDPWSRLRTDKTSNQESSGRNGKRNKV